MSSAALSVDSLSQAADRCVVNDSTSALPEIYRDDIQIAVWQRKLPSAVELAAAHVVETKPNLQLSVAVNPENVSSLVSSAIGENEINKPMLDDIATLVDMFSCLFDLKHVGLRLSTLDRAMCSRFHVDIVPCRLLTTYSGVATEWLAHQQVDRSKLGRGNQGKPDAESGLYQTEGHIQRLVQGEVALLKGEHWAGNEGAGLVHRSPAMQAGTRRLLLTLDFVDD